MITNWLILRGLSRVKEHWFELPQLLQQQTGGEVLCLDLPGCGQESSAAAPMTIAGHTDFLRERFFALRKTEGPWGLLGISLGGMITLDWGSRYPQDFDKIVIINSSCQDLSPTLQRLSPFGIYCLTRAAAAKETLAREKEILKMVSNLRQNDLALLDKLTTLADEKPISLKTVSRQIAAGTRFTCPEKLEVPLLVLTSLKDRMVDTRCSKAIAERLNAQIKFHPTAGHDLPLDDAAWVCERLTEV
jgi:pimeloyl-ACP methyl ester carboxylesterase